MKFIQPTEITAEYKITTPMFLGGAFPGESADNQQFRNASLKGALRFWWRALNWGRILKAAAGDECEALKALHRREADIFGEAHDPKKPGSEQSRVQLVSSLQDADIIPAGDKSVKAYSYLLGMGLYDYKGGSLRPALRSGSLKLSARCKPGTEQAMQDEVQQAMTALGIFGGLGSRARKGLGSLAIQSLKHPSGQIDFGSPAQLRKFITGLDFSAAGENAPLTALTAASRIEMSEAGNSPVACLQLISNCQQLYRDGTVVGHEREKNFGLDRLRAGDAAQGKAINKLPDRAVFGLPHNYFWIDTKAKLEINPQESTRNRRASPLFIHIHQFPNGQCCILHSLLPGRFLPEGTRIELKGNRRSTTLDDPQVDFAVIARYMARFTRENKGEVLHLGK